MFSFSGIAQPQSQFPHSCVCERFIYSQDRFPYFPAAEQADRSWKYINLSQIYECRNQETEHYNSVWKYQFHFWEYINGNQIFILDSHRPFICVLQVIMQGQSHEMNIFLKAFKIKSVPYLLSLYLCAGFFQNFLNGHFPFLCQELLTNF